MSLNSKRRWSGWYWKKQKKKFVSSNKVIATAGGIAFFAKEIWRYIAGGYANTPEEHSADRKRADTEASGEGEKGKIMLDE